MNKLDINKIMNEVDEAIEKIDGVLFESEKADCYKNSLKKSYEDYFELEFKYSRLKNDMECLFYKIRKTETEKDLEFLKSYAEILEKLEKEQQLGGFKNE